MSLIHRIRARLDRGLSIRVIGPNEARILFDGAAGWCCALAATLFCRWSSTKPASGRDWALIAFLASLFLSLTAVFGVYSRLRLALARVKAAVLCGAVLLTSITGAVLSGERAICLLWAMMVISPVVLARLLLSLSSDRHRALARITINRQGPVLVIGGGGYIGSHAVDLLLKKGREVRVLDRLMYGPEPLAEFRHNPRFSLIEGDATDVAKLTSAIKDCSAVIHLAGLVGDPACAVNPEFTRHTNIITTRIAREVAEAMGVHRFIFASSCSVYGVSDREVCETDELHPVSLYAETKIDSERELLANVRDEFFVTILRFATVFGHSRRPRFDLVGNLFAAQAVVDGLITVVGPNQWRPFIHVLDLARAIVMTIEADAQTVQSQIFNVGDRRLNMTILQLAERIRQVVSRDREVEISVTENAQDRRNYAVSFEKIRRVLGFEAETLLDAGIEEVVAHFRNGGYEPYRTECYSNLAMTARAVSAFQDPDQLAHMYAPIGGR
jgi:nucleoside-diphosphate-sugar epimerase